MKIIEIGDYLIQINKYKNKWYADVYVKNIKDYCLFQGIDKNKEKAIEKAKDFLARRY